MKIGVQLPNAYDPVIVKMHNNIILYPGSGHF